MKNEAEIKERTDSISKEIDPGDNPLSRGEKIYFLIIGVSAGGLCLTVLGLLLENDTLNIVGLFIAAPLFLVVLPLCIFLLVVTYLVIILQLVLWIVHKMKSVITRENENPVLRE